MNIKDNYQDVGISKSMFILRIGDENKITEFRLSEEDGMLNISCTNPIVVIPRAANMVYLREGE